MDYIKSFKKYLEAVDNIDDKEAKSKFKDSSSLLKLKLVKHK